MVLLEAVTVYIGYRFLKNIKGNIKNRKTEKDTEDINKKDIKDLRWSGAIDMILEKNDSYEIFNTSKKTTKMKNSNFKVVKLHQRQL